MKLRYYRFLLWLSLLIYTVTSYLLVLRDAFFLERISLTLKIPQIETWGLYFANVLKVNYSATLLIIISFIGSFLGFVGVYKYSNVKKLSLGYLAILAITVFLSFPALSTDIFDYNNQNRVAFLHKANPWQYSADNFPDDGEIYYGSWLSRASVYPPVTFLFSSLVHYGLGDSVFSGIIGFKLLALIFWGLIIFVLSRTLKEKQQKKILLFAINPLVLIEFIGNGHNDLIIGFWILITVYALVQKKTKLSAIAFAFGLLSKFSILLYGPIILWSWFKDKNYRAIILWSSLVVLICSGALLLMGNSRNYLLANLNEQFSIYQKSLPTVIRYFLIESLDDLSRANQFQKLITLPIFVVVGLYYTFYKKFNLVRTMVGAMIFYQIIQAPMLQPWYLGWFIILLPLLTEKRLLVTSMVFCVSVMMSYPVYYLSLYYLPLAIWWQLVIAITSILPPVVTLLVPEKWYTYFLNYYQKI